MKQNRLIIGVTGVYASGKSTFCRIVEHHGYRVINADEIAKDVTNFPEVVEKLKNVFPPEVFDENGNVIRKKLGSLVFSDAKQLQKLNDIVQPIIKNELLKKLEEIAEGVVFFEIPLLFEEGYEEYFDKIVLISTSKQKLIERGTIRDGVSKSYIEAALSRQISLEEKANRCDVIISNDLGFEYLEKQTIDFLKTIQ